MVAHISVKPPNVPKGNPSLSRDLPKNKLPAIVGKELRNLKNTLKNSTLVLNVNRKS
jgi:hypothetical protein